MSTSKPQPFQVLPSGSKPACTLLNFSALEMCGYCSYSNTQVQEENSGNGINQSSDFAPNDADSLVRWASQAEFNKPERKQSSNKLSQAIDVVYPFPRIIEAAEQSDKLLKRRWTPEEDDMLRYFMELPQKPTYEDIARQIAQKTQLPPWTKAQVSQRWRRVLRKKRGTWSTSEDQQLLQLFRQYGNQWALIAKEMGAFCSDQQAKYRITRLLSYDFK